MQANVFIRDLEVNTVIGICDWEQGVEQPLYFDIDMQVAIDRVASSDKIDDALDYADVAKCVEVFVKNHSAKLLESLLNDLILFLLDKYAQIQALSIKVSKPKAIENASCAGLSASLSRV